MLKIIIAIIIMLSPKQVDFLVNSTRDINICSGSIRSGKTYVNNLRLIEDLENDCLPSVDILISGRKVSGAYRNVVNPLMQLAEENHIGDRFIHRYNPDRLIYLPKKITCYVEGANDTGSEERIRGMTIQRWVADEITTYPENFVMQAIGRCSAGKRYKYLTCNPDSPLHYIKTKLIDRIEKGEIDGKVWYFDIEHDNPVLKKEYIEQLKRLYTGVFYDRYILGKWTLAEGVIYDKFRRDYHVIDKYPKDRIKEYCLGIDWGYENPMAILLIGITGDKQFYVIDELYLKHQVIDDSLKDIIKWDNVSEGLADPSRPEYIYQFSEITNIDIYGGSNAVNEGIQEVQKQFVQRDNGEYGLYICSNCVNIIKELENYRWKENRAGMTKDEPLKEDDHCLDALRYVIYSKRSAFDFKGSKMEGKLRVENRV